MSDDDRKRSGRSQADAGSGAGASRADRLGAALRQNLARRKAQGRARKAADAGDDSPARHPGARDSGPSGAGGGDS